MAHAGLVAPQHVKSPQTRDRTLVPCIGRQIPIHCTTREVHDSLNGQLWGENKALHQQETGVWLHEHSISSNTEATEAEFEALTLAVEQNGRKYLQPIYLIRDLYPEYII